jgi:hypothetical protein
MSILSSTRREQRRSPYTSRGPAIRRDFFQLLKGTSPRSPEERNDAQIDPSVVGCEDGDTFDRRAVNDA